MKRLPAFIFVSFLTVSSVRGVNAEDAPAAPVAPAASAAEVKTPETLSGRPLNSESQSRRETNEHRTFSRRERQTHRPRGRQRWIRGSPA